MESIVENLNVEEVFDRAGLVFGSQGVLHLRQVGKGPRKLLSITDFLDLLDKETGGLTQHDSVLTFICGNGRHGGK